MGRRSKPGQIVVPQFRFFVHNELEVITAVGQMIKASAKRRIATGAGLPRPKDGSRTLYASGQIYRSVDLKVRAPKAGKGGNVTGAVLPTGKRSELVERAKRDRRRINKARGVIRKTLRGLGFNEGVINMRIARAIKRKRYHVKNMDVAAILARPPKDVRSRKGGRQIYNPWAATDSEEREAAKIVQRLAVFELVEVKSRVARRGRGVLA